MEIFTVVEESFRMDNRKYCQFLESSADRGNALKKDKVEKKGLT